MQPNYISPAPWSLNGNGIVLLYKFPASFIEEYGFLEDFQKRGYKAGIGAVIMMDYKSSGVGPYRELLFLPGLIQAEGSLGFTVSKIYVSTYDSARSGKRNWGIPKELADFKIEKQPDGSCNWKVKKEGNTFFEATVKQGKIPIPFTSRILPLTRIIQKGSKHLLLTKPAVSGKANFASLQKIYAEQDSFPPVQQLKPLATLTLQKFLMKFPVALQLGAPLNTRTPFAFG